VHMVRKNWFYSYLMIPPINNLPEGKKIYFASDFHLGVPTKEESRKRELRLIDWLNQAEKDAAAIFILGDIFDFWFEYKYTVPKGFTRLLGKLAFIRDGGIPIYFFTGNHDMWMFDYIPDELGIPIFRKPMEFRVNKTTFLIGHGDGLGPGDHTYKLLKKVFENKICQKAFALIPSYIGMGIANIWSRSSRISNIKKDEQFLQEKEWLFQFCKVQEKKQHYDYYVFGHRHLPLQMKVNENTEYFNLGEWVNHYTYAVFENNKLVLKEFGKNP